MRPAAHIQATIELLDQVIETAYPADRVMAKYFRERRYIGSKDKAAISENFYEILRQKLSLSYLLEKNNLTISSRNLAALLLVKRSKEISDYFNNEQYSPKSLYQGDIDSLKGIDFKELDEAPEYIQLNVPEWITPKLKFVLKDKFVEEMQASNLRATTDIRVNLLKSDVAKVAELNLNKVGLKYRMKVRNCWQP